MRSVNILLSLAEVRWQKWQTGVSFFYFVLKFDLVKYDTEVIVPLSDISAVDAELFCLQVVGSRMEGPVLQKQV